MLQLGRALLAALLGEVKGILLKPHLSFIRELRHCIPSGTEAIKPDCIIVGRSQRWCRCCTAP